MSPAQVQAAFRGHRVCRGLHGGGSISESNPGTHSHSRPQNMQRPVWWTVNLRVQSRYRQPFEATKFAESCMVEGQSVSPVLVISASRCFRVCRGLQCTGSTSQSSTGTDRKPKTTVSKGFHASGQTYQSGKVRIAKRPVSPGQVQTVSRVTELAEAYLAGQPRYRQTAKSRSWQRRAW